MAKQAQPQEPSRHEQPQDTNQYRVRLGWFVFPLLLIGMYACLKSVAPVLTWDRVMDWLNVQDRERYTMLAVLCLSLILLTAIWRIIRK